MTVDERDSDYDIEIKPPRTKLEDTEMDITPMIDITFLLLIFFIVASKIDDNAPIKLPPADYGQAVPLTNSIILTVVPAGVDSITIYRGSGRDPKNEIPAS